MMSTSDPNDFDPREYGIVGFDPLPGYDDTDDRLGGTVRYADGTTRVGELPRAAVEKLGAPPAASSTPQTAEMGPPPPPGMPDARTEMGPPPPPTAPTAVAAPAPPTPAAPPAASPAAAPTPYDAFEEQQAEREKNGKGLSIDIPKSSRIAYIHNNPGNLKYAGQAGAQEGEPAEDGGHWAAFETPEAGYSALHDQIAHDAKAGMTLGAFITKYAPPTSNDTAAYIASASRSLGADPNTPISSMNQERLARFMAHAESSTTIGGVAPDVTSSVQPGSAAQHAGPYARTMDGLPAAEVDVHGTPLTPDQIRQRQQSVYDSTMQQVGATQQAAAARVQGRNEALEAVRQNYVDQQTNANRQLAEQTQIKAQAAQNVHDTLSTQIDSGRLFKQTSGGGLILGLLGTMLSAAGQTMQQRKGLVDAPNLAVTRLNKAIDEDVEDQKQTKQGRLAYWTRVYGDAGQAIAATKAELLNASAQYLQAKAQTSVQNSDIQAAALQQAQQLQAAGQQQADQIQAIEEQKLQIKYAAPKPVKPGNVAEDADKTMKLALHMEELGYKPDEINRAVTALTPGLGVPGGPSVKVQKATAEQQKADLAAKKAEEAKNAMNEDQGKAEDAMASIQDLGTKAGLIRDPKTHLWKPGPGLVSPATKEAARNVWGLNPFADKPIRASLSAAAQSYGHFMAGARIDPDKLGIYERLLGSEAATRQQAADALNAAELTIFHRRSAKRQEQPQDASSDGFEATE